MRLIVAKADVINFCNTDVKMRQCLSNKNKLLWKLTGKHVSLFGTKRLGYYYSIITCTEILRLSLPIVTYIFITKYIFGHFYNVKKSCDEPRK